MELLLIIKYSALFFFGLLFILIILGFLFYKTNYKAGVSNISEEIKNYYPDVKTARPTVIYYYNRNTTYGQQINHQQKNLIQPRSLANNNKSRPNQGPKYTVIREL